MPLKCSKIKLLLAFQVEPLEQVIDDLKEKLRIHHILRLQQGSCSIEVGFVWSDVLTNLERVADHLVNVGYSIVNPIGSEKED